ncbi:MAG: metal-sulfur cluster assembly factor [Bacteroidia bacterium]|nr:metal-sulfur cluster assembly factor [Bacteroidia bacterium]MCZ2277761.1 metal-sulfur cluster assembly factor [Bacteroidia bacterium]
MNVVTNNDIKCNLGLTGLYNVDDPEIGLNVVDLGLIYELNFNEEEKKVVCLMTLTTEFCPMGESIVENVTLSLQSSFQEYTVEVNLTFDPAWSYDMISENGRAFLGR